MKIVKRLLIVVFCGYLLSGCATIPMKEAMPTYNINGTAYLPLVSLCNFKNINWEYDTFTRTVILSKDAHKISLMVGDTLVLVDGLPQHLKDPIDIYQGTVVVPYKFKEQILDKLFKEFYPVPKAVQPVLKIKKIIIDAGHGRTDPGAIGRTGLREKDVTLDIAKRLSKLLIADGVNVVMTRSTDRFIPLSTRVDIANNSHADLFISIHANANRVRSLTGFEVYYISPSIDDSKRALSAAGEAELDLDSSCFASRSQNLKAILWDMIYTYSRAESIELARYLCRAIDSSNLNVRVLGIKGANYYVLKGVRMPAVLIEVGFLSNYNEERMLKNNYYRQQIASAIVQGIENYNRELILMEASR
jgi:N-acetylmuramoyl-L-alanine amidase